MDKKYLVELRIGFVIEPNPQNVFYEENGGPLTLDRLSRLVAKYFKRAEVV